MLKEWNSASQIRVGILRKRESRKLIVNRKIAVNKIFLSYCYLRGVTVTILTKITISHSEIILQMRSHALSTCLKLLFATSHLRTLVDEVASVHRRTLRCFGICWVTYANVGHYTYNQNYNLYCAYYDLDKR